VADEEKNFLSRSPVLSRRIVLVFWNRGIHLVPRLRVGGEAVHLRMKPARIIQAAGDKSDNRARHGRFRLCPSQTRPAICAKATLVFATLEALCEMILQLASRQPERL